MDGSPPGRNIRNPGGGSGYEYDYDYAGKRILTWVPGYGITEQQHYWDNRQFAYWAEDGTTYFEHQDALGTERMRTNSGGAISSEYSSSSLPFNDGDSTVPSGSGSDQETLRFAGLDKDSATTSHAQFREYSQTHGRWMSPDPYDGSYDPYNPQSFNRYSYVLNNPLGGRDPSGLECVWDDGSFDGADDLQTGSFNGCSAAGGTFVDPGAFGTLNAGDWSDQSNAGIAGIASTLSGANNYTNVTVYANGSGYINQTYVNLAGNIQYLVANDYSWPGDRSLAPNNGNQNTRGHCLGQALKSDGNGASVGLDILGIGAGFLPGGGLVTGSARAASFAFGAQVGLTAASAGVSIGYKSGPGIVGGILGGQVALTSKAAESLAVDVGKSIPIVGVAVSAGALLYDGYQTYKAYSGCLTGVHE